MNKNFDIFISHASEDKDILVRPLAKALRDFGVLVWYDEFSLTVGDSLSRSIDRGLADSSFGLLILSPNFLQKAWPEYELRGLIAREVGGRKLIIPIWHKLDRQGLLLYSPTLADKFAFKSEEFTVPKLACKIIEVVKPELFEKIQRRAAFLSVKGKIEMVETNKILFPPPRHERLPLNLISRIRLIRAALLSVEPHSMKHWIDGFRGDTHPSREIRIWEHIAACYIEYCSMSQVSLEQYKTVFDIVVQISLNQDHDSLTKKAESLPPDALPQLLQLWQNAVPPFDIEDDPFPFDYNITDEDQERLWTSDKENFPYDVPDELIAQLIAIDDDNDDLQLMPPVNGLKVAQEE